LFHNSLHVIIQKSSQFNSTGREPVAIKLLILRELIFTVLLSMLWCYIWRWFYYYNTFHSEPKSPKHASFIHSTFNTIQHAVFRDLQIISASFLMVISTLLFWFKVVSSSVIANLATNASRYLIQQPLVKCYKLLVALLAKW